MKLRFYAKDDQLVSVPGAQPAMGQPPRYVGRKLEVKDGVPGYPGTGEAFECDEDSATGRRLVKLVRRENSLTPADAYTAAACGLEFKAETKVFAKPSAKSALKDE